jgi:hypothetical protein
LKHKFNRASSERERNYVAGEYNAWVQRCGRCLDGQSDTDDGLSSGSFVQHTSEKKNSKTNQASNNLETLYTENAHTYQHVVPIEKKRKCQQYLLAETNYIDLEIISLFPHYNKDLFPQDT